MGVEVLTEEGVRLHVEVDEAPGAGVTVVFSHGFTAELNEFVLQREALKGHARVVLYDQRGHGRSGRTTYRRATIDQLGRDLQAVLDKTCPTGPVVLVGHSMGGMTLMAWARQYPREVGDRVVGAFLLSTSAGRLVEEGGLARVVSAARRTRTLAFWLWLLRAGSPVASRIRKRGTDRGFRSTKFLLFGTDDADDPNLVRMVQEMLEACDLRTATAFYGTFLTHDETAALPVLGGVPTTVLCGTTDRLTPVDHSRSMAEALGPLCELIEVPGCGHSVNVTRSELVNGALLDLVQRAVTRSTRSA